MQGNFNKPVSHFQKGKKPTQSRNISHIMKKYNHANLKSNGGTPLRGGKNQEIQHKRSSQNLVVLDSINKNIENGKGQKTKSPYQKQRVLMNYPQKNQKTSFKNKEFKQSFKYKIAQNSSRENKMSGTPTQKQNKFLVSKNQNQHQRIEFSKKRNFSPMMGKQNPVNPNSLFPKGQVVNVSQNNLNQVPRPKPSFTKNPPQNTQTVEDSLGGGSKINTKTGSMLNFGNGSRIPDNLSVISR